MPPILGIALTLIGVWFLYQAFQRRNLALQKQAAAESGDRSALTEPSAKQAELQQFASGCAPVVAGGIVLLALIVSAIALVMDGPRRLSIFDILGLLFFAGSYAFSMMVTTFYNSTAALALSQSEDAEANADERADPS